MRILEIGMVRQIEEFGAELGADGELLATDKSVVLI
jgi:hypothetical protein